MFTQGGFFAEWPTAVVWPLAKLTFFLMYVQLFRPMKWLRYCSYAGAVVNVLWYSALLITELALTVPHPGQSFLEQLMSPRKEKSFEIAVPTASINLIFDVYIFILPIAGTSKLQLPLKRKLGVMAIFMTGLL